MSGVPSSTNLTRAPTLLLVVILTISKISGVTGTIVVGGQNDHQPPCSFAFFQIFTNRTHFIQQCGL